MLAETEIEVVQNAEAKALATSGPHGINVVPVSVVKVVDQHIYLYDFFMGKTVENICEKSEVAFTAWSGLSGLQLKAKARYFNEGDMFLAETQVMKEQFPERTLSGIIELTPMAIYDISAGTNAGQLLHESRD